MSKKVKLGIMAVFFIIAMLLAGTIAMSFMTKKSKDEVQVVPTRIELVEETNVGSFPSIMVYIIRDKKTGEEFLISRSGHGLSVTRIEEKEKP